jgi:hypothetical protein
MAIGDAETEDGGIAHGGLLRRYAEAILTVDQDPNTRSVRASKGLEDARDACISALGVPATVQAASVVASFDGINRVADATGIRLDPETAAQGGDEIIRELGYEALGTARA